MLRGKAVGLSSIVRPGRSCCSRANACTKTRPLTASSIVIYEHASLLAVNKPPGVPFHSKDGVLGVVPTLRRMTLEGLLPQLGPLYPLHRLTGSLV